MKVWLDDERDPIKHEGWEDAVWVKTPAEAIALLARENVTHLSLDNDLGLPDDPETKQPQDGYSVARWLEFVANTEPDFQLPEFLNAHTANPIARKKMEAAFAAIRHVRSLTGI